MAFRRVLFYCALGFLLCVMGLLQSLLRGPLHSGLVLFFICLWAVTSFFGTDFVAKAEAYTYDLITLYLCLDRKSTTSLHCISREGRRVLKSPDHAAPGVLIRWDRDCMPPIPPHVARHSLCVAWREACIADKARMHRPPCTFRKIFACHTYSHTPLPK